MSEAKILERAGFDRVILENFGDAPFYKDAVPAETVAAMAIISAAVIEATRLSVGVNVLRNDLRAAQAIGACVGADFARVNVLSGVTATDQGLIEGQAAFLARERQRLGANALEWWADVLVKHGQSLSSPRELAEDVRLELAVEEVVHRAGAQAFILTGLTTGRKVALSALKTAARSARGIGARACLGSGVEPKDLPAIHAELRGVHYGIIVGSALRANGKAGAPLDLKRVKAMVAARKDLASQ